MFICWPNRDDRVSETLLILNTSVLSINHITNALQTSRNVRIVEAWLLKVCVCVCVCVCVVMLPKSVGRLELLWGMQKPHGSKTRRLLLSQGNLVTNKLCVLYDPFSAANLIYALSPSKQ